MSKDEYTQTPIESDEGDYCKCAVLDCYNDCQPGYEYCEEHLS